MLTDAALEYLDARFDGTLELRLVASPLGLRELQFLPRDSDAIRANDRNPLILEVVNQLEAYFAGRLRCFDLPLDMRGTAFQLRVWQELQSIPFGETRTYASIATAIGSPAAVRAVGAANGANPVAIIVPCHRVIGANGKLVGYGGGLPLKQRLLELEGAVPMRLPE